MLCTQAIIYYITLQLIPKEKNLREKKKKEEGERERERERDEWYFIKSLT